MEINSEGVWLKKRKKEKSQQIGRPSCADCGAASSGSRWRHPCHRLRTGASGWKRVAHWKEKEKKNAPRSSQKFSTLSESFYGGFKLGIETRAPVKAVLELFLFRVLV